MNNALRIKDELMGVMSEEIKKEIDAEVLAEVLVEAGWYPVKLARFESMHHAVDISMWLAATCQDDYHQTSGARFLFKSERDAAVFALRWL